MMKLQKKRIETFKDLIITPKERLAIFDVNMTSCSLLCWLVYLCIKKKNKVRILMYFKELSLKPVYRQLTAAR